MTTPTATEALIQEVLAADHEEIQVIDPRAAPKLARIAEVCLPAIRECKGLLSAHEIAIRHDYGNTNYEVAFTKLNKALAEIERIAKGEE